MKRLASGIRSTFDSAARRARNGGGRVYRDRLYGTPGKQDCLAHGEYSGVQAGPAVSLAGLAETRAIADVLREAWNTAGTTLTLRLFRRIDQSTRVLVSEGTVTSGPTTVKGVSEPNPALPLIAIPPQNAGNYEVEVETSGGLKYAATLEG